MISTFTAFIDANVFYGARLRSLVLFVAQTKLFRARWSERIHDEWIRNLIENRPDLLPSDLDKTRLAMDRAVPGCLVEGYEPLIEGIKLPDPDDRHVVAAAIMTRASVIVTFNERDFPCEAIQSFRLDAKHPDEFMVELYDVSPKLFIDAVKSDFIHYRNPSLIYPAYLESLSIAGVPKLAELLKQFEVLMPNGD